MNTTRDWMDALESRQLLSADLTAMMKAYSLPKGAKVGTVLHGKATVLVTNKGPDAVDKNAAKIAVAVEIEPGNTPDLISTTIGNKSGVKVAGLAKNKSVTVSVPITITAANQGGTFSIVAIADSSNAVSESNELNNSGAASKKYTIAVAHPTLKASAVSTTIKDSGAAGTGQATISNAGDVALKGKTDLIFEAVPDDSSLATVQLGKKSGITVNLKPKKTVKVKGVALASLADMGEAGATYTIQARLVTHTTPADQNSSDDTSVAGTATLSGGDGGGPTSGTNILADAGYASYLVFGKSTSSTNIHTFVNTTTGSITDGAGHTGTFTYVTQTLGSKKELTINFPAQGNAHGFKQTFDVTASYFPMSENETYEFQVTLDSYSSVTLKLGTVTYHLADRTVV